VCPEKCQHSRIELIVKGGAVEARRRRQQCLGIEVLRAVEEGPAFSAIPTILPRYTTAIRRLMCSATAKSWATPAARAHLAAGSVSRSGRFRSLRFSDVSRRA